MKRVLFLAGLVVLLIWACSKKSSEPQPPPTPPVSTVPVIDSISSYQDWPGETLTIFGDNFEADSAITKVYFGETFGWIDSIADDLILSTIPDESGYCSLQVRIDTVVSNSLPFTVNGIDSVIPDHGDVGDEIYIFGHGFGDARGTSTIAFGGAVAATPVWKDSLIVAYVPQQAASGYVELKIGDREVRGDVFAVERAVTDMSPAWGTYGQTVIITGVHFGDVQGSGRVRFNGTEAPVHSWVDTLITTEFPFGCTDGDLLVSNLEWVSNPFPFEVFGVTGVVPDWVMTGNTVNILGTGFRSTQGNGVVKLGEMPLAVHSWSDTLIRIIAPDQSADADLSVYVNGQASNSSDLRVSGEDDWLIGLLQDAKWIRLYVEGCGLFKTCYGDLITPDVCDSGVHSYSIELNNEFYAYFDHLHWNGGSFEEDLAIAHGSEVTYLYVEGSVSSTDSTLDVLLWFDESRPTVGQFSYVVLEALPLNSVDFAAREVVFEVIGSHISDYVATLQKSSGGSTESPTYSHHYTALVTPYLDSDEYTTTIRVVFTLE